MLHNKELYTINSIIRVYNIYIDGTFCMCETFSVLNSNFLNSVYFYETHDVL
jgi:hypothetical protein